MRLTKRRALFLCAGVLLVAAPAAIVQSADHRDAPATTADPASDINDVYSFIDTADGNRFVMIMTVSPFAGATAQFSDKTQYVFHTSSAATFGATTGVQNKDFICTFDTAQKISCWAGTDDYVTGDASKSATPLTSTSGKMKVFAGLRADPFFFNLQGFKDAVSFVDANLSTLAATEDSAGCPQVGSAGAAPLQAMLAESTSPSATTKTTADDFTKANTLAIVLSVDKSLVTGGGNIVSVWASTHRAP